MYVVYDKMWVIHICTRGLCCVTTLKQYDTVCGMYVVYDKMWVIHICTRGLCCVTTLKHYGTVCGMYVVYDKHGIHILYQDALSCHYPQALLYYV